jgi:hypothetical protein
MDARIRSFVELEVSVDDVWRSVQQDKAKRAGKLMCIIL